MTRVVFPLAAWLTLATPFTVPADGQPTFDPALYQAKEYRLIGPSRGGRSAAVTGVPGQDFTFYMGTGGGGVWKTDDAGTTWANVSDGFFESGSVGAVAVAPSDPNVVFAGTGEACLRGDVRTGVGLYKSEDAGKTWRHSGLADAGQIGKIRIHPRDHDLIYVAVLGHAFGPNEERGVYRSKDGGGTWQRVLYVSERAGAVDLAMNPANPRVLYAAVYQVLRQPWTLVSGGEDSGLYRTTDGGETWSRLNEGLPTGLLGRIGVTVSPADPERVYVIAEAQDDPPGGGLYRSDDAGESFKLVSRDGQLLVRPFYFSHVVAHPTDADTIYVMSYFLYTSIDGGKSFTTTWGAHADHHDLWVNPENPRIMVNGNDGGASVTLNGGDSWSTQLNQPTAEIYRLDVDNSFPYRVYGSQQDNSTISLSSDSLPDWGRNHPDWYAVGGGEQGDVAVHPENPNVVYAAAYAGLITRYDHATRQARQIEVYPQLTEGLAARDMLYRFQMNAPIEISPHDPERVYFCSQYVHVTSDGGESWRVISPDLTTNDAGKQQPAGGPITLDQTGPETYTTIFAFRESPHAEGLLWAGTDDGRVHVSRDAGGHWEDVTPDGMPEWGTVNDLELSAHGPGRAFIPVHRYRLDDFTPYVFATDDYGRGWRRLSNDGIAPGHFVRVIREDPERKGLLYAGTEFGMYVSFDDGGHWQSLRLNLPVVQVADMKIHDDDLVVATHGRSFWILDDLSQFRQIDARAAEAELNLFSSKAAVRPRPLEIYYTLAEESGEDVLLEVLDGSGNRVRSFSKDDGVSAGAGMNRFEWDLSYPAAEVPEDAIWARPNFGPTAVPGTYQVRLTRGGVSSTRSFEVRADPRLDTSQEDFQEQFDLAMATRDQIERTFVGLERLRRARDQLNALSQDLPEGGPMAQTAHDLVAKLSAAEDRLTQTKYRVYLDVCNHPPRLDSLMLYNLSALYGADAAPTEGVRQLHRDVGAELDAVLGGLEDVLRTELDDFNRALAESGIAHIRVSDGRHD